MKLTTKCLGLLLSVNLIGCSDEPSFIAESTPTSAATLTSKVQSISQSQLDSLANSLVIKYNFISNLVENCPDDNGSKVASCYSADITLTNPIASTVDNWSLYYSQVFPTYASSSDELTLNHVNGDIHEITPQQNFSGFKANEPVSVRLWVKSTLITESELMPNYWLSAQGLTPAVVISTKTKIDNVTGLEIQPYVKSFDNLPLQTKSAANDLNTYASANWLFTDNQAVLNNTKVEQHLSAAIIPTPTSMALNSSGQQLDLSAGVVLELNGVANADVSAALERLHMLGVEQTEGGITVKVTVSKSKSAIVGSYRLSITEQGIVINASDSSGAFYALQSLAALKTLDSSVVPLLEIVDQPRYQYRGQHIDVARNFHDKELIIGLIKQMAAYKLNKLHLHLAEDEGWRLEIPSLPELTEVGAKRCMDLSDSDCLQPQLGSAGESHRDGFYTVADYIEILQVASAHHIQVIPSLDMPGHSRAAVKSMEARYKRYMLLEQPDEATRYLLSDLDDKTQYRSIQHYNDNTLNICMESTYTFIDRVLTDLKAMHTQANHPLSMYHIGADETAGAWIDSPACDELINATNIKITDAKHLGAHFIERVSNMVANKGISVGGWNDGLSETDAGRMPSDVYSYIWGTFPGGAHRQVSEQAHRGWKIILSTPDLLYFDFPYEIDPKERGYRWASRRANSRNIFNFMPDNLPIHAEFRVDTLGQDFVSDDRQQLDEFGRIIHKPLPNGFNITGIQGQLWSETVRTETQAQYMMFPRILAFAQRAWHQADWEVPYNEQGAIYSKDTNVFTTQLTQQRDQQWFNFSQTLAQKELPKLELANIFYRLPTVGAQIVDVNYTQM